MENRSTLQMAAALALLVVGATAVVYAILTTAPTGADVGPSEAALRCREDSLALVEGATTSAALAGGDGIVRGTLSGPGFEAEWACTYLEGPDGWLITSGLTDYRRK